MLYKGSNLIFKDNSGGHLIKIFNIKGKKKMLKNCLLCLDPLKKPDLN